MYTGIVETTGRIVESNSQGNGARIEVETSVASSLEPGDSVAVSGVCVTVEGLGAGTFTATLSAETVRRTYLADLDHGASVNVESPVAAGEGLSGHVVKGTVDCTSEVVGREERSEGWGFSFAIPDAIDRYVVEKGAIAVDGASLTVAGRDEDAFEVAVVPETYRRTTLSAKDVGDPVHLEADVLAKYAQAGVEACV